MENVEMITQSSDSCFSRFNNLPRELRWQIWRDALPSPGRLVTCDDTETSAIRVVSSESRGVFLWFFSPLIRHQLPYQVDHKIPFTTFLDFRADFFEIQLLYPPSPRRRRRPWTLEDEVTGHMTRVWTVSGLNDLRSTLVNFVIGFYIQKPGIQEFTVKLSAVPDFEILDETMLRLFYIELWDVVRLSWNPESEDFTHCKERWETHEQTWSLPDLIVDFDDCCAKTLKSSLRRMSFEELMQDNLRQSLDGVTLVS